MLDPDKIKENLKTKRVGGKILVYDSTSSTNDVAAEYARNERNDGLVVFAEEQTAGRGRAANKWLSGRADSILCSVVLIENTLSADLLSLTCAVAVAETIGKPGRSRAKIKWPNDIMLNGKKVAGILLESKSLPLSKSEIGNRKSKIYIVGIGINCHQPKESFTEELRSAATSMDIESGAVTDRISLAKRLLSSLDHWLEVAANDAEEVIDRWRELSIQLSHRVTLLFDGAKFTGHCIGIDPEKGLILQLDTGGIRMFDAAHTTIAK
ncbi:MAG: biotin--[acetyl-CoA-carboxylase] ligase [Planctomycetota bacterium]|jgi:BirA family biotin operon repressor/biotin-[acetyl-CoA-carboxylase] ligase